ncbi:hypothetical protein MHU86_24600 [Fragilaria crotonensis]|nr:hypothetical protein MHU86_24600 [Fragilaria crotonensis]
MAIVYVSSDEEEGSSEWIHVLDTAERNALRRKFQVGSTLQEAKFTVPSLFVIDSASHGVMTPMGLIDLKEKGSEALEGVVAIPEFDTRFGSQGMGRLGTDQ